MRIQEVDARKPIPQKATHLWGKQAVMKSWLSLTSGL
jgi:hypothetical protein